jgi:hypothetical protein
LAEDWTSAAGFVQAGAMVNVYSSRRMLATAAVCALAALPSMAPAEEPLASKAVPASIKPIGVIGPIGPAPIVPPVGSADGPYLRGHLSDLTIKPTKTGKFVKVKGMLKIENIGRKLARSVRASVYLSPDRTRDQGAELIAKLDLAAYDHGDGKIKELGSATIPLEYKLPTLIASNLTGKYLILVLAAKGFPAGDGAPIVEGPLPKVP